MAPAGTGKTKVISLRVAGFINQGIEAKEILCLTFTIKLVMN
ncbi:MAG: UvrD-helicase domain-containing protein [Thomasclavelia ramosa]